MNFCAPFIRRPVGTSLLMLSIFLLGLAAFRFLPIAALPQVEFPTIQITAALPGASAEVMASSVVTPLERNLALIPGVVELTSSSSPGKASIVAQFNLNRSIDAAAQDVQAAINASGGQLPKNLPNPPAYEKANPADFNIMSLAVTSDVMPLAQVDYYADSYVAQQLSKVNGVGLIDLHGEQKPAVRVQIDPEKISALGLSLEDIRAQLSAATVNAPKGTLDGSQRSISVETTDQLTKASAYDNLIVAYHNGAPVRIRAIGRAIDDVEDVKQAGWLGDHRAIIVDIHKLPGFNVVDTVDLIKAQLADLLGGLPPSLTVQVVADRTQTIRASVNEVEFTLMLSVALVVLVVFLFLPSLWATLIPGIAIPMSIVGTFGVMYLLGYSVNNVSLMGLTIATGFVIDDAIVMIENIMRHMEAGEAPLPAALEGSRQVSFTIVSMTASLIAVFLPLLLMGGLVGRLFREFSLTVSVALAISAIVSLTLTPMMCRMFLRRGLDGKTAGLTRWSDRWFQSVLRFYERTLDWALARRLLVLAITIATALLTIMLYWAIPKGFFPQQDVGFIAGNTEAPPDISAPAMAERQLALVERIMLDPDVEYVYSWIGPNPTVNNGRISINLKPFNQRRATAQQILDRLYKETAGVTGINLFLQVRQELQVGGRFGKAQYQYTASDVNVDELYRWMPKLLDRFKTLRELRDVTSDAQPLAPQKTVVIDRDTAARFGITPRMIDDTLYDAFGQRPVATIFTQLNQYNVVLEVNPTRKLDADALNAIYVPSSTGQLIPLKVFAHFEDSAVPLQINHQGQFPAITIAFNLAPGVSLGEAVKVIEATVLGMGTPATLHGSFQGTAKAFKESLASQPYLIVAAILAVYIVLGILYESYVHPVTILSTIPSAGLGALVALMVFHYDLSIISLIGVILLIGIVKKNAIMMIDFALEGERHDGLTPEASIRRACLLRFRPIMMTTAAAILGALPLALGTGAGSEIRSPLGVAIVGGLIVSQVLTLYTTPVIYLYLHRASGWLIGKGGRLGLDTSDAQT